jgi:hypothetical protein
MLHIVLTAVAALALLAAGNPPPAQAPYAKEDPIPRLALTPHARQDSPRQAAETFLAEIARGYDPEALEHGGGSIGDPQAYARAEKLLVPEPASLIDAVPALKGAAAVKVLQLEPMERPDRFFVEIQPVQWCRDHWATAWYEVTLETVQTPAGWRLQKVEIRPEQLVYSNIGGHQGWQQDGEFMLQWYARRDTADGPEPWKIPWEVESLRYERRTMTGQVRRADTGERRTIRMARIMEGSWMLLSMEPVTSAPSTSSRPRAESRASVRI